MHLGRFRQLLPRNAALLRRIRFYEGAIDRQVLALHQSHVHTLPHDQLKQFLEQIRFLKPPVPILGRTSSDVEFPDRIPVR